MAERRKGGQTQRGSKGTSTGGQRQREAPPKPSQAEGDRETVDQSIREKETQGQSRRQR